MNVCEDLASDSRGGFPRNENAVFEDEFDDFLERRVRSRLKLFDTASDRGC